jgi:hypothetical protein
MSEKHVGKSRSAWKIRFNFTKRISSSDMVGHHLDMVWPSINWKICFKKQI